MAELFKKPSLQATVSPAGWRSVKVATQQAAPSPLIDLAQSLGVASKVGQQVAGLQAFEYKQGVKEGEIAAASADLDEALTSFDTVGEDLVEKGLMPRSQLAGYQVGFRRQTGQREAKFSFNAGLQARLKEVELNPENANFDVIDQIIQEEETNSLERLRQAGGAQLALQGFSEYSSEIKDRFKIRATELRDKAIQKYSENGHIEEFNADFGPDLLKAETPEQIAILQNDMKTRMDELTSENKVPRSRVVELFWNGFAKTAVSDLLFQKQPKKAEKILNAITDIDLTGEGGKLGNINRPNAYIRKETLIFKSQIQELNEAIKKDAEFDANDIMAVFNAALQPVADGPSGIESVDNASLLAVQAFLKDVGFEGDIEKEANDLLKSGEPNRLLSYTRLYYTNDAKREAYGLALPRMDRAIVQRQERALSALSRVELEGVETAVREGVGRGIKAKDILDSYDPSGPITDPAAKVIAARVELEEKENTWFERDESYKNYYESFEKGLEKQVKEVYKGAKPDFHKDIIAQFSPFFKDEFNRLIKEEQIKLKAEPNRFELIRKEFETIKAGVLNNWRDNIEFRENYETGLLKKTEKLKPGESLLGSLDQITEETAEDTIEKIITPVLEDLTPTFLFRFGTLPTEEEIKAEKELDIIREVDLEELGLNRLSDRKKVWSKAEIVFDVANRTGNTALEDPLILMRRKWGYPNPSKYIIEKDRVYDLDFRETPFYSDISALNNELDTLEVEIKKWMDTPEVERNLDDYPVFSKWNEAFGVEDSDDIKAVADAQNQVLKKQSNN